MDDNLDVPVIELGLAQINRHGAYRSRWAKRSTTRGQRLRPSLPADGHQRGDDPPATPAATGVLPRRERTAGLDHQPARRHDSGPLGYLAMRRMPGVRSQLVFGASGSDRTVPSASPPSDALVAAMTAPGAVPTGPVTGGWSTPSSSPWSRPPRWPGSTSRSRSTCWAVKRCRGGPVTRGPERATRDRDPVVEPGAGLVRRGRRLGRRGVRTGHPAVGARNLA
jgi:hypothetical protein